MVKIQRALLSVSDKAGIIELARTLVNRNVEILSTGGTARHLQEAGIPVVDVSDVTGFPELMSGRIKTLHPKIHGALLGRRGIDDDAMREHGIGRIDLLVVNLYPFEQTISQSDCDLATAIENIDIGGPAMLRAAAKNHASVTVLCDPADYAPVLAEIESSGGNVSPETRFRLACKVFERTARYDGSIANYLGTVGQRTFSPQFPQTLTLQFHKKQDLRYGENPHQQAAFYREDSPPAASLAGAEQLQGKALSYNNIADTDTALQCVKAFEAPTCVIVKHANPCGIATAGTPLEAYRRAYRSDPTSAFGGIIAINRPLDTETAQEILTTQFVEVIIAPRIRSGAQQVLQAKPNVRVLQCGEWDDHVAHSLHYQRVSGGLLVQEADIRNITESDLHTVTDRRPDARELEDLLFAWHVAKFVKSNAIVLAKDRMTIGIGAGQMSRVYSAKIAALKAADQQFEIQGSVMASDAFFPFRDGIDTAAQAGITAVIQPGGSKRDDEVIAAANEHGMAMLFTGIRHFRH